HPLRLAQVADHRVGPATLGPVDLVVDVELGAHGSSRYRPSRALACCWSLAATGRMPSSPIAAICSSVMPDAINWSMAWSMNSSETSMPAAPAAPAGSSEKKSAMGFCGARAGPVGGGPIVPSGSASEDRGVRVGGGV